MYSVWCNYSHSTDETATKRPRDLRKVTQQVSDAAGIRTRQSDSGPISPLPLMQTENVFLVLARKGLGDQVSDPVEEEVLLHLDAQRWRTGGRNECKVLMELHGLWGLVFILRPVWIVRSHYFVSLTRYCPAVLVVGLSY